MALINFTPSIASPPINIQSTRSSQYTYSPTITRTFDIQYNIASDGSTISTKKEQAISQQPTTAPSLAIIPSQTQQLPTQSDSIFDYLLVGGLIIGAVLIIPPLIKKK